MLNFSRGRLRQETQLFSTLWSSFKTWLRRLVLLSASGSPSPSPLPQPCSRSSSPLTWSILTPPHQPCCCPCLSAFPGQSGLFHSLEWWSSPWPLELCVSSESDVPTGGVGLMLMVASILNNYNIIVNSRHHLNSLSGPCLSNLFVLVGLRIL